MGRKTNNSMAVAIDCWAPTTPTKSTPAKSTPKATKRKVPKKATNPPPKGVAQRKKPAKPTIADEEYDPAAIKKEWSALFSDPLYQEDSDSDDGKVSPKKPAKKAAATRKATTLPTPPSTPSKTPAKKVATPTKAKKPSKPTEPKAIHPDNTSPNATQEVKIKIEPEDDDNMTMAFDFTLVDDAATPPATTVLTPAAATTEPSLKRKAEHLDDELPAVKTEEADPAAQKAALRALLPYNADLPRQVKRARLLFAAPTVDRYAMVVPVRYAGDDDSWYDSDASSYCGGDPDSDEE